MVKRFEVYLVNLDPQPSKDAKNTRPAVIISPDEMNDNLANVIIAPLSSTKVVYPTRLSTEFLNSGRSVILDQIRSVETVRLVKKIGTIDAKAQKAILAKLQELFAD
ncbi:MAG: type II toxin-antitoxin system PemK/MazF family toxin [Pyrinomonadaceae bacterium]